MTKYQTELLDLSIPFISTFDVFEIAWYVPYDISGSGSALHRTTSKRFGFATLTKNAF